MSDTLEKYAEYLIDRLFDLKAALKLIENGYGNLEPRLVARNAIVADDRAQEAIRGEFEMKLKAACHDSTH